MKDQSKFLPRPAGAAKGLLNPDSTAGFDRWLAEREPACHCPKNARTQIAIPQPSGGDHVIAP